MHSILMPTGLSGYTKRGAIITGMLLILALLFSVTFFGTAFFTLTGLAKTDAAMLCVSRFFYWLCLLLLWLYCATIEKQKLLLWQEKQYSIGMNIKSMLIIFGLLIVSMILIQTLLALTGLSKKSAMLVTMINIFRANKFLMYLTAFTAGVVEELIFRGYLQPRMEFLFKNSWAAIIVSSLLFGLLHYRYGTIANLIGPAIIGFVFACYYAKYTNIKLLIVCHFLWDLLAIVLLLRTVK